MNSYSEPSSGAGKGGVNLGVSQVVCSDEARAPTSGPAVKAPASAPSASASGADLCTWTAAQPGRGAAGGGKRRERNGRTPEVLVLVWVPELGMPEFGEGREGGKFRVLG